MPHPIILEYISAPDGWGAVVGNVYAHVALLDQVVRHQDLALARPPHRHPAVQTRPRPRPRPAARVAPRAAVDQVPGTGHVSVHVAHVWARVTWSRSRLS